MASDHGADFHYVQQAEDGSAAGASSTPAPRITLISSCSYCRGALDRQDAVYCAACMAPHHKDCFGEHGKCCVLACKETRGVSLTSPAGVPPPATPQAATSAQPLPPLAGGTQLQQALAALRETRGHAALNIQQTRLAFDVTRAASESGTMNVKKFKKQA